MVWELLDPQYVRSKLDLIDISLTSLRDAIRGPGARTLTDIYDATSSFSAKFPSAVALADNLGNPTTTIVGSALLGFDGSYWRRVHARAVDVLGSTGGALAVVNFLTPSRQPVLIEGINVGTTEGSTSISAPGAKWLKLKNRGDVDILIGINGPVPATNPLKVKPRTILVIPFAGVTQVNYKTVSGSSILDIEYYS
jgi:hypothetical protein